MNLGSFGDITISSTTPSTSKQRAPHRQHDNALYVGNPAIKYPVRYQPHTTLIRKTFRCWYCPSVQYDYDEYERHRNGHIQDFPFKCDRCSYSSNKLVSVTKHYRCHQPEYFYNPQNESQDMNGSPSTSTSSLTQSPKLKSDHLLKNQGRINVPNAKDGKSSPLKRITPAKKFKCPEPLCPVLHHTQQDLDKHLIRHSKSSEFKCNICSYSVFSLGKLKLHLNWHKRHKAAKRQNAKEFVIAKKGVLLPPSFALGQRRGKGFGCEIDVNCPARFQSARDAFRHQKRHTNEGGPLKCDLCSFAALSTVSLGIHQAQHRTSDPKNNFRNLGIIKQEGGASMPAQDSLPPVKPKKPCLPRYKCEDLRCPQKFHKKMDKTIHVNNLHSKEAKKYPCSKCSYSVDTMSNYNHHMLKHKIASKARQANGKVNSFVTASTYNRKSVYRPGWMARKGPGHRDLVKAGLVSAEQLKIIRKGNPDYNYPATRTSNSGRTVTLPYKCLKCPTAFRCFKEYQSHQSCHQLPTSSSGFECKRCSYKSFMPSSFKNHCLRHVQAELCCVKLKKMDTRTIDLWFSKTAQSSIINGNPNYVAESPQEEMCYEINPSAVLEDEDSEEFVSEEPPVRLISRIEIENFMSIEKRVVEIDKENNFLCIVGPSNCGRTSIVLACLIGLAYDIILDLQENSTLCGVLLQNLLKQGKSEGSIEVALEVTNYKEISQKYGSTLLLKRIFFEGVPLSESCFEISYGYVKGEKLSKKDLCSLISILFPKFITRLMVLNSENVHYFGENIHACEQIFWTLAERQKTNFKKRSKELHDQVRQFRHDLESRQLRMSHIRREIISHDDDQIGDLNPLKLLRKMQADELTQANRQYKILEEQYKAIQQEEASLNAEVDNSILNLVERMRAPFVQFLHSQNYIGDIIVDTSDHQFAVWIQDANSSCLQSENPTIDQARQIWKTLTMKRRELAVTGLFLGFWQVVGQYCPILLSDGYSSSDLEFRLSDSAWKTLVNIIVNVDSSLFIISTPENTAEDFEARYAS